MPSHLRLVWENPLLDARHRHDPAMLRLLGDFLAGASRCGYAEGARKLASIHQLTPLAASVVTRQMKSAGLGDEDIRKIV